MRSRELSSLSLVFCLLAVPAAAGEAEWKRLHDQAAAHLQRGDSEQAALLARQALREAETTLGAEHRATETSLSTLSLALRLNGNPDEALPAAQRLVALRTKQYGLDDPATAIALHNHAEILIAQNRRGGARRAGPEYRGGQVPPTGGRDAPESGLAGSLRGAIRWAAFQTRRSPRWPR